MPAYFLPNTHCKIIIESYISFQPKIVRVKYCPVQLLFRLPPYFMLSRYTFIKYL